MFHSIVGSVFKTGSQRYARYSRTMDGIACICTEKEDDEEDEEEKDEEEES
jgi:hypothetical protein